MGADDESTAFVAAALASGCSHKSSLKVVFLSIAVLTEKELFLEYILRSDKWPSFQQLKKWTY
jgi:hypothetical protein